MIMFAFQISDKLPNVKWAQGTWAGVEAFFKRLDKVSNYFIYFK